MNQAVAYISSGKIHVLKPDGSVSVIESRFGQEVRDRALRIHKRHDWKTAGRGAQFMSGRLLWGGAGMRDPAGMKIAVTSVSKGRRPGEILYTLETDEIGGIFAVDLATGEETRLCHYSDQRVANICAEPGRELVLFSLVHGYGHANIASIRSDGSTMTELTEGDSEDKAPTWIPGDGRLVLMQSAGAGRDSSGMFRGLAPSSVQKLDMERGEIADLAADPGGDLLGPRMGPGGELFYIKRPYRPVQTKKSFFRALLDLVLLPFRLLYAIFQWLNFFTARYTGKPLTTAGGPEQQGADIHRMMVWGNLINADDEARKAHKSGDDTPSLVPASWQLVRRSNGRGEEMLARGVLSFDLGSDGTVYYTNGSAVYRMGPGGKEKIHTAKFIEQLAVVEL